MKVYAGIKEATNCLNAVSSDIWYLHGIFFTPLRSLQLIAYFPYVSLLIFLCVLVLCLGISLLLNYCKANVKKYVTGKKSKDLLSR